MGAAWASGPSCAAGWGSEIKKEKMRGKDRAHGVVCHMYVALMHIGRQVQV